MAEQFTHGATCRDAKVEIKRLRAMLQMIAEHHYDGEAIDEDECYDISNDTAHDTLVSIIKSARYAVQ